MKCIKFSISFFYWLNDANKHPFERYLCFVVDWMYKTHYTNLNRHLKSEHRWMRKEMENIFLWSKIWNLMKMICSLFSFINEFYISIELIVSCYNCKKDTHLSHKTCRWFTQVLIKIVIWYSLIWILINFNTLNNLF